MQQHERQANPEEYNHELEFSATSARRPWTIGEVINLAAEESEYTGNNTIAYLSGLSGRSEEAIKKRRRTPEWQNTIIRHRERREIEEKALREEELQRTTETINRIIAEEQAEPEIVEEELVGPELINGEYRPIVEDPVLQYIVDMAPSLGVEDIRIAAEICTGGNKIRAPNDLAQ